jgi:hypothetical protein
MVSDNIESDIYNNASEFGGVVIVYGVEKVLIRNKVYFGALITITKTSICLKT